MPYLGERVLATARLTVDIHRLGEALQLSATGVTRLFSDGAFVQPLAECWAARRFGFPPRASRNMPTVNKVVMLTDRGVAFSQSATRGLGRQGSAAGLLSYLGGFQRLVVVDRGGFPLVVMWELNLPVLLQALQQDSSKGTWTRLAFLKWVRGDHDLLPSPPPAVPAGGRHAV